MTTREQMVEVVANVIYDGSGGVTSGDSYDIAHDVLGAILPQLTTVAELEALPKGAVVVSEDGFAYEHCGGRGFNGWTALGGGREKTSGVAADAPLTVVWTPEPEASR